MLLGHVRVTPGVVGGVGIVRNSEQDGVTSTGVEIVPSVPTIPFVINPVEFIFFIMKMDKDSVFVDVSSCMLLIVTF